MRPHIAELARIADVTRVSAYPNAGLPNELGGYDETPQETRRPPLWANGREAGLVNHRRRLLRHHAGRISAR